MDEDQPIKLDISLYFQIEDVKMQYAAMEKYMEGMDKVSWEYRHAEKIKTELYSCLLYTSPSPRDLSTSRMPSSA